MNHHNRVLTILVDETPSYDEDGAYVGPNGERVNIALYGAGWIHKADELDKALAMRLHCHDCNREVIASWEHTSWLKTPGRTVLVACPEHYPALIADAAQSCQLVLTP